MDPTTTNASADCPHASGSVDRPLPKKGAVRPVPDVGGALPLIGHAIAFGRDPDGFFARCRQQLGDLFALRLPRRRIFVLDPLDYVGLFQNEALDFTEIKLEVSARVFGFDPTGFNAALFDEFAAAYVHLKGKALGSLSDRITDKLVARLDQAIGAGWTRSQLFSFIAPIIFASSVESLFGDGMFTEELYQSYLVIDRWFGLLALGVPPRLLPGVRRAQQKLAEACAAPRPGRGQFLTSCDEIYEKLNVPKGHRAAFTAAFLWASQANTIATAFWAVYYIFSDPATRAALSEEARAIPSAAPSADEMRHLSKLDSAISEAMRLTSVALVMRRARTATFLPLASGGELQLAAGDEVCLYTRTTHMDPEIYPEPNRFIWDRYLAGPSGPKQFFRRGQKVNFHLIPFGGGANMCPGRFVARNEFKALVATLLSGYDLEILDHDPPQLTFTRGALGPPPPVRDVPFRIRRRDRKHPSFGWNVGAKTNASAPPEVVA